MLIKYIRDSHRRPKGVVISTGEGEVGYSLCNKKDKWNRETALRIAFGRAVEGFDHAIPDSAYLAYYEMLDRSDRYYKSD